MKDPQPINLITSEEVRENGWAAEERDADGHLVSCHAPFNSDEAVAWYVCEAVERGNTVTVWSNKCAPKN